MSLEPRRTRVRPAKPAWHEAIARFTKPDPRRAVWQLVNTLVPYAVLWAAMAATVLYGLPYWVTLLLAVPAAVLAVRIFIFFHDAGHGSFFASSRANAVVGYLCGILTFTPYHDWHRAHALHHATAGNLDRRGVGDVWMMTVDEYLSAPRGRRLAYRIFRNPLVMFGLGPAFMFLIVQRFPRKGSKRRERLSVVYTDLALAGILVVAGLTIGLGTYVAVQLPVLLISGLLGLWLFFVQHQYEGVYWARDGEWDATRAALEGSSYYKLPAFLRWCTGNIGLHHIHHLRPRIANYHLQPCMDAIAEFQQVRPLTFARSLKSLRMNLWDERQHKLVTFRAAARSAQAPTPL
jgi:omega-6 fatty acid desaturase (delta-12 desaturase)